MIDKCIGRPECCFRLLYRFHHWDEWFCPHQVQEVGVKVFLHLEVKVKMDMALDSDKNLNDLSKVSEKIDVREGAWTSIGTDLLSYPSFRLCSHSPTFPVTLLYCKSYSSPGNQNRLWPGKLKAKGRPSDINSEMFKKKTMQFNLSKQLIQ